MITWNKTHYVFVTLEWALGVHYVELPRSYSILVLG